jgi:plasmid stabilization system protein ParE
MKSGYKLFWSDRALDDLRNIIDYLTETWTQKEIKTL